MDASINWGAFISTFFSIILFNFIDSDFAILLKDATIQKLVYQLVETNLIKSFADIFTLSIENLSSLDRMAAKSAQNQFCGTIYIIIQR